MRFRLVEEVLNERYYFLHQHTDGKTYAAFTTTIDSAVDVFEKNLGCSISHNSISKLADHKFNKIRNSVIILNKDEDRGHRLDANALCRSILSKNSVKYNKILAHHRTKNEKDSDLRALMAIDYTELEIAKGAHCLLEKLYADTPATSSLSRKVIKFYTFEHGSPVPHTITVI